jgi:hypothetical protein
MGKVTIEIHESFAMFGAKVVLISQLQIVAGN